MQEKIHLEHEAEIESLRSRFRFVALTNNMDRSPSESSLEKIEDRDKQPQSCRDANKGKCLSREGESYKRRH
ncbi:unnamed protein product [Euphydryas editha]|uniref:Uncharacterized protein n=1 Tax=Euphydryas editha TaxID=104508 RepID=A0AAU9TUQ7_EUPED|nr:unnamed protein product [Euphydryas editha]